MRIIPILNDTEVITFYKTNTISATYQHFKCGRKKIEDILIKNNISFHTDIENKQIISEMNRKNAIKRETAKRSNLDEAALIEEYNKVGLAKAAYKFHISPNIAKNILLKNNSLKGKKQYQKEKKSTYKNKYRRKI